VNLLPLFGKTSPIFTIAKRVQSKYFKLDLVSQFSTNSIFLKFHKGGTLQNLHRGVVPSWQFQSSTIFGWVSIIRGVHDLITYMIDGYQLEVFFSIGRGSSVGFNVFLVQTKKLKDPGDPLWFGPGTGCPRSLIIRFFYSLVDPASTILSVHDPRSSVHDHALGLCPRSCVWGLSTIDRSVTGLLQSSQTATL